jgi:GNAT superfamily N-acetyltransferase
MVIGVVRGRADKIFHLFVLAKYHHAGIGRELMKKFEAEAKRLGGDKIKLNASLYAVPFYQKMGYEKSTGIRNLFGLKVWPMKKVL